MRVRRVGLTGDATEVRLGTAVLDDVRGRWVPLLPALARLGAGGSATGSLGGAARGVVEFLAGGEQTRDQVGQLLDAVADHDFEGTFDAAPVLPFEPRLQRNYTSWPQHWEQAARGLTRRYLPAGARAAAAYERLTKRTFPMFAPGALVQREPTFYIGNHLTTLADGETVRWPSYARDLDYELELAAVVVHPLLDATAAQAEAAIGGFLLYNDFTARDEQWKQTRQGVFGPTGKAKSFASALGTEVVTPDEVLPHLAAGAAGLEGTVTVNGEVWSRTSTAGMLHGFGEMLAYASRGEQVQPGELVASGTLPGGAGVEIDHWLSPGDTVTISLAQIGRLSNVIGPRASVAR